MTRAVLTALVATMLVPSAPAGQPQTKDIVHTARAYVAEWQNALSSIVAEELYTQRLRVRFGGLSQTLRLRSDLLLLRSQDHWFGFRDIAEVDGRPIAERTRRLEELFITHPLSEAVAQAKRISDEGARYNLGTVSRNFNVPTTALQILEAERDDRVEFKVERAEQMQNQTAAVLSFRERKPPTLIFDEGAGHPLFTHGRLWLDPVTGRILATEVRWRLASSHGPVHILDGTVSVSYHPDPKTGIWVPQKMTEKYESDRELLDCEATYSNVRRFSVTASEELTTTPR
jgi:hypothetical protein